MPSHVDGKYPPYYVYAGEKLVEINERWIERDYNVAYPVRPEMWRKFCRDGVHSAFDAKVMSVSFKPSAVPIVVVRIPHEMCNASDQDQFVWCMRASITADLPGNLSGRLGDRFLWPLSPNDAYSFWRTLSDAQGGHPSRLITDYRPWIHPSVPTRSLFDDWIELPGTFELEKTSELRSDHLVVAAVKPSTRGDLTQPDQVSQFMTLPSDQLRFVSMGRMAKRARTQMPHPFDLLHGDSLDSVLHPLVLTYINTPAYGAHRNWTALRGVSCGFRDSVDGATVEWVARAKLLSKRAMESRMVAPALELRNFVVPTGLDVLQVLGEVVQSSDMCYRHLLLIYMRLRGRKKFGAMPPAAPPRPPPPPVDAQRAVDFGPRMFRQHGKLLENEYAKVRTHNTRRANEEASIRVRFVGRVPRHLVNYAKICCGWQLANEPESPGLDHVEDSR